MKIIVLGGGDSPEREVSLRSAKCVADAARQSGLEVIEADPADGLKFLDSLNDIIVLPILHGENGEDGIVQKELESRGLPFLGTESGPSKNCFDKWITRQKLSDAGIPMPKAELVNEKTYKNSDLIHGQYVLKIPHGGSSIGTLIVRKSEKLSEQAVSEIFTMEDTAVLEELIEGSEVTVPILDGKALPVIEIIPPAGGEFDYENKYNGRTQELCPPKNVSGDLQKKAQSLAEKVYRVMNARHLARVDIMIDRSNNLYVLEINTMPGMTDSSLYPKSALQAGMDMPALIKRFVSMVQRDYPS